MDARIVPISRFIRHNARFVPGGVGIGFLAFIAHGSEPSVAKRPHFDVVWQSPASGEAVAARKIAHAFEAAAALDKPNLQRAGLDTLAASLFLGSPPWFPFRRPFLPIGRTWFVNFGREGFFLAEANTPEADDDRNVGAGLPFKWAARVSAGPSVGALEASAFSAQGALPDTHRFAATATKFRQRYARVLRGRDADKNTAIAIAWMGGLRCLAASRGLLARPANRACDLPFRGEASGGTGEDAGSQESARLGHRCAALGARAQGKVETLFAAAQKSPMCLFQRSLFDDRFPFGELESKIVCMNESASTASFPAIRNAKALIPAGASGHFFVYEGVYSPPKVSILDVASGQLQETLPARPLPQIPEGFEGVYACERATDDAPQQEWFYTDAEVFVGMRPLEPENDRGFRVTVEKGALAIEPLDWDQVNLRAAGLASETRLGCVLEPALDARCATKMLHHAGKMAEEILAGAWEETLDPGVVENALALEILLLGEVERRLPRFLLAPETSHLKAFFVRRLTQQTKGKVPLGTSEGGREAFDSWWKDEAARDTPVRPQLPAQSEARGAFLAQAGLTDALFAQLEKDEKQ